MATLADVLDAKRPRPISTDGSRDKCDRRDSEPRTVEPKWFYVELIQQVDVKVGGNNA